MKQIEVKEDLAQLEQNKILIKKWSKSHYIKYIKKMAKYRARQINEIEAEQFLPPNQIPKGGFNVYSSPDGTFYSG